jgi:hypothetical protein
MILKMKGRPTNERAFLSITTWITGVLWRRTGSTGSQEALTYRKTKYDKSSSIKLQYLIDHSYLGQNTLRYNGTDIRIGMMDTGSKAEKLQIFLPVASNIGAGSLDCMKCFY